MPDLRKIQGRALTQKDAGMIALQVCVLLAIAAFLAYCVYDWARRYVGYKGRR